MKIERAALASSLNLAAPALAQKDLVQELSQFWFFGDSLVAFNDVIGIDVPLKTEFTGGLRGSLLLGLLDKSKAREVTIEAAEADDKSFDEGTTMLIKAGGAKLKMALLPTKRAMWQFPEIKSSELIAVDKAFMTAVKLALVSVGDDTSVPDQLGITVVAEDDMLNLYSTDSKTMSWLQVAKPKGFKAQRSCWPRVFCEQLLRLCKDKALILVTPEAVIAENEKGVRLYSRLVDVNDRPLDFDRILTNRLPKTYTDDMVPVPNRLHLALERAAVVLDGHAGEPVLWSMDKEYLRMEAKTAYAEIKDVMRLEDAHAEIKTLIDPLLVRRVIENADGLLLTDDCLVLCGPNAFIHLIASVSRTS